MIEQVAAAVVHIELTLDESLHRLVDPQDNLAVAVRDAIEHEVSGVVRGLGIPGIVVVESRRWPRDGRKAYQRWMRLHINGQVCRFPDQLLGLVHSYVEETLPSPDTGPQTVLAWLKKILEDTPGASRNEECIAGF